ncbi:hypothetical protein CHLNCDRAFT_142990 [Chlorella variabilis]|uniref:PCI domain-containing protein n=1 Tax=Chlorella variabilis TaxID=554065 RepID=E1Z986_CHLVA|nr:hypothetical protein CHLNCDRAFT_142990 [Chlorella variabilis]EFN57735.1 hypothetical protein CHLNCDRAFT_142990 [Chlorella variabilis]|eukprot:XP_005849837.1 hypothetical protein CHLNCDRAFT_142990 [Chlorella variabilis]
MADLGPATAGFAQLQAAFSKGDLAACKQLLSRLKLELTKLPALPPVYEPSPNAQQQLTLARQVLELAVFLSIKQGDEVAFERNFAQLRVYYGDARPLLPPSDQEATLTALNLLRLLVQNRIAEFHTELEVVPPAVQAAGEVAQVVELEQWLMEGAYNKVLDARARAASDYYKHFLDQLSSTVREEVASCSERAYNSLSVADAAAMMMLGSEAEVVEFAAEHGWEVSNGRITFKPAADKDAAAAAAALPSLDIINHCLNYAREVERIV